MTMLETNAMFHEAGTDGKIYEVPCFISRSITDEGDYILIGFDDCVISVMESDVLKVITESMLGGV